MVEECVSDANTIAVLESEIYTPERSYALFFFSVELVFDGRLCDVDKTFVQDQSLRGVVRE